MIVCLRCERGGDSSINQTKNPTKNNWSTETLSIKFQVLEVLPPLGEEMHPIRSIGSFY